MAKLVSNTEAEWIQNAVQQYHGKDLLSPLFDEFCRRHRAQPDFPPRTADALATLIRHMALMTKGKAEWEKHRGAAHWPRWHVAKDFDGQFAHTFSRNLSNWAKALPSSSTFASGKLNTQRKRSTAPAVGPFKLPTNRDPRQLALELALNERAKDRLRQKHIHKWAEPIDLNDLRHCLQVVLQYKLITAAQANALLSRKAHV